MKPLTIGITCYPSIGGSGILASALGEELALRGHDVHFISYERPVRMPLDAPRIHFHPVAVNAYGLFKYPDYTLPLSVKMAEVSEQHHLDILHVHYAVPHATAALLARSMLGHRRNPRVLTTLHGTDTTLLGMDPGYGPAIRHALEHSNAITTVSAFLKRETQRVLAIDRDIEVIPNFFSPRPAKRPREEVRRELGVGDGQVLLLHSSNLRPLKRIDLLLEAAALIDPRDSFKLLILAGDPFEPFRPLAREFGIEDRIIVREKVSDIEEYLGASDLVFYSSEMESFCLSILEGMCFGLPCVSTAVGGIPEVVENGATGLLVPFGAPEPLARAAEVMIADRERRQKMGEAARLRAQTYFSAEAIVPKYEALYRRL
jgi:N-acetyl-alpha-D-glucosaminyl L-malate synthase BshA